MFLWYIYNVIVISGPFPFIVTSPFFAIRSLFDGSGNARRLMHWAVDRNATKEMQYLMFESLRTGNITYKY
jgi:hypothetical protein